jgi:hypothetical protein
MFDDSNINGYESGQQNYLGRSANDGALLGIMLAAFVVCMMLSSTYAILALVSLAIFIAVPFVVYGCLKRSYKQSRCTATFSMLWMQGINTFICGGLIMALAIFVYLRFIDVNYITDQITETITMLRSLNEPGFNDYANTLQELIDKKLLPTPISIAFTNMFTVVFTGSLLSIVLTLIVRVFNDNVENDSEQTPPPYNGK